MYKDFFRLESIRKIVIDLDLVELGELRFDNLSWISNSPYFCFGKKNPLNDMQNNIAFYTKGKEKLDVDQLSVVLNINNPSYKNASLIFLDNIIANLIEKIGLDYDFEIRTAITNFQNYHNEFITIDTSEISEIDTIKFTIRKV